MFKGNNKILKLNSQSNHNNPQTQELIVLYSPEESQAILKLKEGDRLQAEGKIDEAIESYRQAIELNPNLVEAYHQMGEVLKQQGNEQEAINYYRQAVEIRDSTLAIARTDDQNIYQNNNIPVSNLTDSGFSFVTLPDSNFPQKQAIVEFKLESNSYLVSLLLSPEQQKSSLQKQSHLEAAQIYLQQALEYSDKQEWLLAAEACQRALEIDRNSAEAYKILGNALQRMGKTAEAMGCYGKAVEIEPDLAEVYANVASLYAEQQKWDKAIEYFQKAIVINPNLPWVYSSLAKAWNQLGETDKALECSYKALTLEPEKVSSQQQLSIGNSLLKEGKLDEALAYYYQAIEFNPNCVEAYQRIGEVSELQQRWQEAASYYRQALELKEKSQISLNSRQIKQPVDSVHPNNSLPSAKIGNLAELTGIKPIQNLLKIRNQSKKEQASVISLARSRHSRGAARSEELIEPSNFDRLEEKIQEYLQKATIYPNNAKVQANLGSLYARQQNWQQAIVYYQKAIKLDPSLAVVYRNLSLVFKKTGQQEAFLESLDRALTLKPDLAKAEEHLSLGHTLLKLGKPKRAISCFRQAIQLQSDYSQAYHSLGETLSSQGQALEAIACYQAAIEANPQDIESYYRLGQALVAQERLEQAIVCYQKLIAIQPNHFQAHYNLADVFMKRQNWYEAIKSYYQAIDLNPNYSWAYNHLGIALLKIKRCQKAAQYLSKASQLNPDYLWSYYHLGEAYIGLEKWDEAIKAYSCVLKVKPNLFAASQKLNYALSQKLKANDN